MDYFTIKAIHQTAVVLSFTGFFARGIGALTGAAWVRSRAAKTWPHVIDSVLLLSALTLAWMIRLDPTSAPWLTAKIGGLVVYIGLGVVALRPGRSVPVRAAAWLAALATFGYIVSVAISKNPAGFFGSLASFDGLVAESRVAGPPWQVVFAAGLASRQSPSAEQVERALETMVAVPNCWTGFSHGICRSCVDLIATELRQPCEIFKILLALSRSPVITGLVLGAHQAVRAAASVGHAVHVAPVARYRRLHM